jgi:endonuclease YncB( thermonuclease family)
MSFYQFPILNVIRIVDGDTVNALVDLGFKNRYDVTIRLVGIDAPEKTGVSAPVGLLVKDCITKMLNTLVAAKIPLVLRSESLDMYGRALGDIEFKVNGVQTSICKELVSKGLVHVYTSGARPAWTPESLLETRTHAEAYLKS